MLCQGIQPAGVKLYTGRPKVERCWAFVILIFALMCLAFDVCNVFRTETSVCCDVQGSDEFGGKFCVRTVMRTRRFMADVPVSTDSAPQHDHRSE